MEYKKKPTKTQKILIKSNEGNVIGEHRVLESGEKGIWVKNKGFVPYRRLLSLMAS